jgi:uncharacterized protein
VVSRRGMGRSEGESVEFFNDTDATDYAAVIDWVSRQDWCDGNVFLFGTSYYAVMQPAVAVLRPPALKGFFAIGTDTDYFSQLMMYGGVPQSDFLSLWLGANFTDGMDNLHVSPTVRAALSHVLNSPLKKLWHAQVQKHMNDLLDSFKHHEPAEKYRRVFANWLYDGKTRATHHIPAGPRARLDDIDVPFVVVHDTGSFNIHQFGGYDLYQRSATPRDRKWLIVAPPEFDLPVYRWQEEALAFFDHITYGADNGYADQPTVRYRADGTDSYHGLDGFPVPGAQTLRLYPSGPGAAADVQDLVAQQPESGTCSWAATPFGAVLPAGMDEVANPSVGFEMTVTEPSLLAGPVTLSVRFSSNEIDSHVIARLARVDQDGHVHHLSMGSIRPAQREVDESRTTRTEIVFTHEAPQPLVPDVPVTLRFSLTPFPVRLVPGERLRLDLASRTDVLRSDVEHGFEQFEMTVPPYFSRNTVHFGAETYLEVDRLPEVG